MYADMYYILTAFSFVFLFFVIFFTEEEWIKVDRYGNPYDATFYIVTPLIGLGLILHIILAYESWNVETLYVVGNAVQTYRTESFFYFLSVHLFLFFVHIALLSKNIFDFYQSKTDLVTKNKENDWYEDM